MSMEDLMEGATKQGLVLVDTEGKDALFEEYEEKMLDVERLLDIVDPDNKPYESKYKAREVLDQICKKLDASKAIATLENKKDYVRELSIRIAAVKVKTGSISWDCEEPHATQQELEQACSFYFPTLLKEAEDAVGKRDELISYEDGKLAADIVPQFQDLIHPELPIIPFSYMNEALSCLNILGILWAGRGQPHKSLIYLHSSTSLYKQYTTTYPAAAAAQAINAPPILTKSQRKEIENTYTHTLFYLAQAYGHLKSASLSSLYCKQTLQRQYAQGLPDIKTTLEWIKNCIGISDFYLSLEKYQLTLIVLQSAELLLKEKIIPFLFEQMEIEKQELLKQQQQKKDGVSELEEEKVLLKTNDRPNFVSGNINAAEIEAELHHRFAIVDAQLLKKASEILKELQTAEEMGYDKRVLAEEMIRAYGNVDEDEEVATLRSTGGTGKPGEQQKVCYFDGLSVPILPSTKVLSIRTFEQARIVFLRAVSRIDSAKKYYVLDGFVTDYCTLLQEYSKLYHYLQIFDPDYKRKIAMENKRVDLLLPLMKQLNRTSFEVLHKQISYELGETALTLIDLKLDKLRAKDGVENASSVSTNSLTESQLKKSEIVKCNEYCKLGIVCFTHFIYLYAKNEDRTSEVAYAHLDTISLPDLVHVFNQHPDESLITAEEVRPFFMANFLLCRLFQKVIVTPTYLPKNAPKGYYLIQCLKRYEWLSHFVPRLCERRGMTIESVFQDEYTICQEMVKLLPSKIDRMVYLGESGLTL